MVNAIHISSEQKNIYGWSMSGVSVLKCQENFPITMEFEVAQEKFFLSECLKSNWKDCVKSYIVSTLWEEYTGSIKSVVEVSEREDLQSKIAEFGKL